MLCIQCVQLQTTSKIIISNTPYQDIAWSVMNYYDENGNYHSHNKNTIQTMYRCTNGHTWVVESDIISCPLSNCTWTQVAKIVTNTILPIPSVTPIISVT